MSSSDDLAIAKALADGDPNFRFDPEKPQLPGSRSPAERLASMADNREKSSANTAQIVAGIIGAIGLVGVLGAVSTMGFFVGFVALLVVAGITGAMYWGASASYRRDQQWLATHAAAIATARGQQQAQVLGGLQRRSLEDQARLDAQAELDQLETSSDRERQLAAARARLQRSQEASADPSGQRERQSES